MTIQDVEDMLRRYLNPNHNNEHDWVLGCELRAEFGSILNRLNRISVQLTEQDIIVLFEAWRFAHPPMVRCGITLNRVWVRA